MKLVFMGNPQFAVPSLKRIIESSYSLQAIVCNPPKRSGRGKTRNLTPVGEFANRYRLSLLQPQVLDDNNFILSLKKLKPDYFLVVGFKILPGSILEIPTKGSINLHASLLPLYRGAAPIQRAIMNGDKNTGLTTFYIRRAVDTGSILMQSSIPIHAKDDFGTLSEKMSVEGAELLMQTLDSLNGNAIIPREQNHSQASFAPKIREKDCRINWHDSAKKINYQIRGLSPNLGAFTNWNGTRVRILQSEIIDPGEHNLPGEVVNCNRKQLVIQTGNGQIKLLRLQREGKNILEIQDFLNGTKIEIGDRFDS